MNSVTVTASRERWEALLAALPHCRCGELAEVEHRGVRACLACAASSPGKLGTPLAHGDAAIAITDALSPFLTDTRPGESK
ncbi:MAG TPA: hypothetical protein VH062_13475 [Polyangiaceae bacterium]|jgi:hypothetical protein|nr:hypothetical protein [Polyangiaceae bacterium]